MLKGYWKAWMAVWCLFCKGDCAA